MGYITLGCASCCLKILLVYSRSSNFKSNTATNALWHIILPQPTPQIREQMSGLWAGMWNKRVWARVSVPWHKHAKWPPSDLTPWPLTLYLTLLFQVRKSLEKLSTLIQTEETPSPSPYSTKDEIWKNQNNSEKIRDLEIPYYIPTQWYRFCILVQKIRKKVTRNITNSKNYKMKKKTRWHKFQKN